MAPHFQDEDEARPNTGNDSYGASGSYDSDKNRPPMSPSSARAAILARGGAPMNKKGSVVTDHYYFPVAVSIVATANMIVVGLEVDVGCEQGWLQCSTAERGIWYAAEHIFTLFFLAEMAIRIASRGPTEYFRGDMLQNRLGFSVANSVDFAIVLLRVIDSWILAPMDVQTVIKVISCARILHITELVRRAHRLRELWMILHGVWHAGMVVFWTIVVLLLILYITAIVMTHTVIKEGSPEQYDYSSSAWELKPWTVHDYWGTVPRSLFSLFQILTLDHWCSTLARPLVEVSPNFIWIFIPFLALTVLSLLNVIVAVIVESTLASAAVNEEKIAREEGKTRERIMCSLKELFEDADTDGSGELDRNELEAAYSQQHVRDRLKVLQLEYADLMNLFDLLDFAGTGNIKTSSFFRGCTKLRGAAMNSDLHHMSVDFGRYVNWAGDMANEHHEMNDRLANLLANIEGLERDVVSGANDKLDPVLMSRRDRYCRQADPLIDSRGFEQYTIAPNGHMATEVGHHAEPKHKSLVATALHKTDLGFDVNAIREAHGLAAHMTLSEEYEAEVQLFSAAHQKPAHAFDVGSKSRSTVNLGGLRSKRHSTG